MSTTRILVFFQWLSRAQVEKRSWRYFIAPSFLVGDPSSWQGIKSHTRSIAIAKAFGSHTAFCLTFPGEPHRLREFASSHRLAHPSLPWERLKIGIGPPPVLTKHGWLLVYHGVCESNKASRSGRKLTYSAGVMILSEADPRRILYRSPGPLLIPETEYETQGVVADVVFPTGIDRRDDIGLPDRFDVYYGMADDRIGVARLDLPSRLSVPLGDQST